MTFQKFANKYLSKEEQREIRATADEAKIKGASVEEVRGVVTRRLNAMLTPEEKREIAEEMDELNRQFGDSAFFVRN